MLILKQVRNWSYETLEREVRANVAYRSFCRIGMEKLPDAKTLVRLGPETIGELHDRLVAIAQARRVVLGSKLRVDTTVVDRTFTTPLHPHLFGLPLWRVTGAPDRQPRHTRYAT